METRTERKRSVYSCSARFSAFIHVASEYNPAADHKELLKNQVFWVFKIEKFGLNKTFDVILWGFFSILSSKQLIDQSFK